MLSASLGVSTTTDGGDERREPAFELWHSVTSKVDMLAKVSPRSALPLAEWMLSMLARTQSGW